MQAILVWIEEIVNLLSPIEISDDKNSDSKKRSANQDEDGEETSEKDSQWTEKLSKSKFAFFVIEICGRIVAEYISTGMCGPESLEQISKIASQVKSESTRPL